MLVLERSLDEAIIISTPGGDIKVQVKRIWVRNKLGELLNHPTVYIGIDAPASYLILRGELVHE